MAVNGASMAVFCGRAVLLVRRAHPPLAGLWSLPGGKREPGERAVETALREVREETGITAWIVGQLGVHTVRIDSSDETGFPPQSQIEIDVFYGTANALEPPIAADDAAAAAWVPLEALGGYDLTEGTADLILEAAALLAENYTHRRQ